MFKEYWEHDLFVIPLNGKIPVLPKWQDFSTNGYDESVADKFDSAFSKNNIGVVCGPASGICALDIDTDDKRLLEVLPNSTVRRRGKKGEARFFKYNPILKSAKNHDDHIELFVSKCQIVLPPSIHPETKRPYEWVGERTLIEAKQNDELPELHREDIIEFFIKKSSFIEGNKEFNGSRNNKLLSYACKLVRKQVDIEEGSRLVYEKDQEWHPSMPYFFFF